MHTEALRSLRSSLDRLAPLGHGISADGISADGISADGISARVLRLGIPELDAVLPQHGLTQGTVTELQVRGLNGAATSFALCACRAARAQLGSSWCVFIDPTATLFAPGVARLGVDLEHLLVVRPAADAVSRVAVRVAEANIASVLIIDLSGAVANVRVDDSSWQRTVRRLSLAVKSTLTSVLLITRAEQFQSLPLPTYLRLEFTRRSAESFEIRVGKERTGRVSPPRTIALSAFDPVGFEPSSVCSSSVWEATGARRVS